MLRSRLSPLHVVIIGVVGIVACWLLATPRYAGPDEPSHVVASAALVRGHRTSSTFVDGGYVYRLPSMVADPDPACFAFDPLQPASCAGAPADSTALTPRQSTAWGYPIWGHLLPGLASFIPAPAAFLYLARLLNSAVATGLLAWAFARARRGVSPWLAIAIAAGCTPIVWFTLAVVSPSAIAIGGGAALWVGALVERNGKGDALMLAGWLAVLLPRRDGPVWATLIVLFASMSIARPPSALFQRLSRVQRWTVIGSWPLTLLPTFMNGADRLNTTLALAPLLLVLVEGVWLVLRRRGDARPLHPLVLAAAGAVVAVGAVGVANVLRPGGPDLPLTLQVVSKTGRHLRQLIGVLGWLDTPVPELATVLFWIMLGLLAALALISRPRQAGVAAGTLAAAVVVAWVLELGSGDTTTVYWQGRYSLPLAIGIPLVLANGIRDDGRSLRAVLPTVASMIWLVWNTSFYWALHRWAVGTAGVIYPWRWADDGTVLPSMVFIAIHAILSGALLLGLFGQRGRADILDAS